MKSFRQYLQEKKGKKTDDDKYLEYTRKQGSYLEEKELEETNVTNDLGEGPHIRKATTMRKKVDKKKKTEKEPKDCMEKAKEVKANTIKLDHYQSEMLDMINELVKITESTPSYRAYKNDESTSNKVKFNQSLKKVQESLKEIDSIIENNIKLKTEFNMKDPFWKISRGRMAKISEMLNRVNNRLKELSR